MNKNELIKIKEQFEDIVIDIRKIDNDIMFNCNSVVKKFGDKHKPAFFLRNAVTKRYIEDMMRVDKLQLEDIVFIKRGGKQDEQGTWMHYELFLEYLRTVNAPFARWTNKIIIKLLTQGQVVLKDELELLRNENKSLVNENELLKQDVKLNGFYQDLIVFDEITINEFAGLVNMSVQELYDYLRETNRIQKYKNKPYQKEINNGNFKYMMCLVNGRYIPTIKLSTKIQKELLRELN